MQPAPVSQTRTISPPFPADLTALLFKRPHSKNKDSCPNPCYVSKLLYLKVSLNMVIENNLKMFQC
jgi:hypothetical protein